MSQEALEAAKWLDEHGFNVLPAKARGKTPAVKDWKEFQTKRTTPQLAAWFGGSRPYNYWIACGSISQVVVLDVDNREADLWWRDRLGAEILDLTTVVRTAKGFHYYFRLADGETFPSWSRHDEEVDFDVRGDGTGVIVPPSIHETGHVYEWVRGPEQMQPVPKLLHSPSAGDSAGGDQRGAAVRSMLAELLQRPPQGEGSGRNNWLAQVAGHLARWVPHDDAYAALIRHVNYGLPEPLPEDEVAKLIPSIWNKERAKTDDLGEPTEHSGWIIGDGERLYTLCRLDKENRLMPWGDFDLRCTGVINDESGLAYNVEIRRPGKDSVQDLLVSAVLGNAPRLSEWLARHEAVILAPANEIHKNPAGARLQRYLKSQDPPAHRGVAALGWHDGLGFVTHEGIIDGEGLRPHEGIVPAPHLRERALYRYGMRPEQETRHVLQEVLTFHDETVTAVFGAWWTACLIKAQLMRHTRQFPFMALEAPSESGKTSGYFSLMVRLAGNTQGHGEATTAALRDQVASHRNGIVWVDDMDDVTRVLDLLRQATGEGSRTKKGNDRFSQETVKLVAPILLSGEGLGAISREKALVDRAVILSVPSPTGRRSQHDLSRPQWDDILDLEAQYPDLSEFAGRLVQMALARTTLVSEFRALRPTSGRFSDKIACLRVGARVLADMVEQEWVVEKVDEWCGSQEDLGAENMLTREVLPRILRDEGMPTTPTGARPAFIDADGIVWFNEQKVADRWEGIRRNDRLGSLESIRAQRQALGGEGKGSLKDVNVEGEKRRQVRYHPLALDISMRVLQRTGQAVTQPVSRGVSQQPGKILASGRLL